ncbi:hypothetical protein [Actinomyces wuliandei]|uniref:hypothetical protein n=1 Tax=Actinomyces wuliandei TaxID=2057743 RepID=UPI000FDB6F4B|nr:hypothetical protein [Actinomyces wuliandei]
MTIIIHPVGDGDLNNDIVQLSLRERGEERQRLLGGLQEQADSLLGAEVPGTSADMARVAGLVLDAPPGARFSERPLAPVLRSQARQDKQVTVLLVGTSGGREGTPTEPIAELMEKILCSDAGREGIRQRLGQDVSIRAERVTCAGLEEKEDVLVVQEGLSRLDPSEKVVINGVSGATTLVFAIMGAADMLGRDWCLAAAPGAGENKGAEPFVLRFPSREVAPFYWLRSLGYLEEAQRCPGQGPADDSYWQLAEVLRHYQSSPCRLGEEGLATIARLSMARADTSASLALRAWAREHYRTLRKEEEDRGEASGEDLFLNLPNKNKQECAAGKAAKKAKKWELTLGEAIGEAEKQVEEKRREGRPCPGSVLWLSQQRCLNEIGTTTHSAGVPSGGDIEYIDSKKELPGRLPSWISRPGPEPVLYTVPCGSGAAIDDRLTLPERVLTCPPEDRIWRAVPGGMLSDRVPLPVMFLLLHSSLEESQKMASRIAERARSACRHKDWRADDRSLVERRCYGAGKAQEHECPAAVLERAQRCMETALEEKGPAAVVIVGTGQKQAVYGALGAAQEWCATHAVPLFLQTFIDESRDGAGARRAGEECGRLTAQLHRIALHRDAEQALCQAALTSLRSLNLVTAVRVLSAGDSRMTGLAEECDSLRQDYQAATAAKDRDRHAGVILDVLRVVSCLARGAATASQDQDLARLLVVAAEISRPKKNRKKGTSLLHEGPCCLSAKGGSGRLELNTLGRGDLKELLYEARNRVVITHGKNTVATALEEACAAKGVSATRSLSELLERFVEVLEQDAGHAGTGKGPGALNVDISSDWKRRFDGLVRRLQGS